MERGTKLIDKELEELRTKIRGLEAQRQGYAQALERSKAERKKVAFSAHSDGDAKSQERLSKARATQREAELAAEDLESAISEGRKKFEELEAEREERYREEKWQAALALASECMKQAEQIDSHIQGFAQTMAVHQAKLEQLRLLAHESGREGAFRTVGIRHAFRVLDGHIVRFAPFEAEKPSEVYRQSPYAQILASQIDAAAKVQPVADSKPAEAAEGATA